ncbi:MAG: hypothetical protein HY077_09400 [Elusimicrobia bacterium]|nr:hypothetical protein [Elusimicrobiota bacterium]
MSGFNKDGNLFGRVTALITLVVTVVWIGRICGVDLCPMSLCGTCPVSSGPK